MSESNNLTKAQWLQSAKLYYGKRIARLETRSLQKRLDSLKMNKWENKYNEVDDKK